MIPEVKGKIDGVVAPRPDAGRVGGRRSPATVEKATTIEEVNAAFRQAASGRAQGRAGVSDEPLVSVDYIGNLSSSTVDALSTNVIDGTLVNVTVVVRQRDGLLGALRGPACGTSARKLMKRTSRDLAATSLENQRALDGQRALVRVDFNCPVKDGVVTDNTRIRAALPDDPVPARPGRPRGAAVAPRPAQEGARTRSSRCAPVVRELEQLLGAPVRASSTDPLRRRSRCTATKRLPRGGVARASRTPASFPARRRTTPSWPAQFAALGDFYVNDAFGSAHRAHASTEAVARVLKPAVLGLPDGAGTRVPRRGARPAEASVRRGARRRQDLRQDRPHRGAAAEGGRHPHRRRDGVHLLPAMGLETGNSLVEADRVEMAKALLAQGGRQAGAAARAP